MYGKKLVSMCITVIMTGLIMLTSVSAAELSGGTHWRTASDLSENQIVTFTLPSECPSVITETRPSGTATYYDYDHSRWFKIYVPSDNQTIQWTLSGVSGQAFNGEVCVEVSDKATVESCGGCIGYWRFYSAITKTQKLSDAGVYYIHVFGEDLSTELQLQYNLVQEAPQAIEETPRTYTPEIVEKPQSYTSETEETSQTYVPEIEVEATEILLTPSQNTHAPSLSNFYKNRTYSDSLFADNNSWGKDYLVQAYEYGIISGKTNGKIDPNGTLSGGEAVTIAARIHATYKYGDMADDVLSGYMCGAWYSPYAAYCKAEGLIGSEFDELMNVPVTRTQMVGAWRNILSESDMQAKNNVDSLPDVNAGVPFYDAIIKFYEAGIISGTDATGTFKPYSNITRQECAAIFMKMIMPNLRSSFTLSPAVTQNPAGETGAVGIKGVSLPIVSAGIDYSLVVDSNGSLWAWGYNELGQLGDGTTDKKDIPVKIMNNVAYATTNKVFSAPWWHSDHTVTIKTDGSLWAWGGNSEGQLGNGKTKESSSTPIKIMDNVASVSAGAMHTVAIKTDGSLWAWGQSNRGALGNGTTADSAIPIKIMDDVVAASAGAWHTMAIKKDGSLWAWGSNTRGELDDGTNIDRSSPIKIMDDVVDVSAGFDYTMAIKKDGSLWAWGMNYYGQLGDGGTTERNVPVKIIDNVAAVSTGCWHTMAIKTDGSLWGWGTNDNGQIGNGSKTERCAPVKIMDDVKAVSAGQYHTMAVKTDGSLWIWGWNADAVLGDGTNIDRLTPVRITLGQ